MASSADIQIVQKVRHGTTAEGKRYYHAGSGCKILHPLLLPLLLLCRTRAHGTMAPKERYYRDHLWYYRKGMRYYRSGLRYYRSEEQYYRKPQNIRREDFILDRQEEMKDAPRC